MDPGIIIPVKGYGGIERIIEMLALEHAKNGHEVHLLVTTGSVVKGCIVHELGKEGFPPNEWDARKAIPVVWKFLRKHRNEFDLVHNFGRLIYLLPILNHPVKKIMSYQREINPRNIRWANALPHKNLTFTGCSQSLINRANVAGNWEAVYNACDFSKYNLTASVKIDAPLFFLGRIEKIKGCHTAINVAKATGNTLIIAGNISTLPEEKDYYEKEIAPHIDGEQIQYIGTVNDEQKNEWLGKAKALLFPIEWNEPFGIVMVEAMACGTPVIAFNHGSVNEVVDEGVTGFKVNTEPEMIAAINKVGTLPRTQCRQHSMNRFNVGIIAARYLDVISENRKRIVIISTHQPAANPRAMKEYETLKAMGYWVKFLYEYNTDWSYRVDEKKFESGLLPRQDYIEAGGNPHKSPIQYFSTRFTHKLFKIFSFFIPFNYMASSRAAYGLWRKVKNYPAQLYVAHYLGALPAAVRAANKNAAKVIFDAEDFHRGEQSYYDGQMKNVVEIENRFLPGVNAVTTASPLITEAYQKLYPQQNIITVSNVFSKHYLQPKPAVVNEPLKLFWFSQHIGRYRGLEVFIEALNYLPAHITLTIMGNKRSELYLQQLLDLSKVPGQINFRDTVAPEEIFSIAAQYDIGLAGEIPNCYNKEICLSNKIFTYLLAGNCILASDMQGQKEFIDQNPGIGFVYKHDDANELAGLIEALYKDRTLLGDCKNKARELAEYKMNWEEEKKQWLNLVKELLYTEDSLVIENKNINTIEIVEDTRNAY